jgi:L-asparaginase
MKAAVAAGTKGIISAGFPSGAPSPAQKVALKQAVQAGIVVVQASRSGSGRTIDDKVAMREAGFIAADSLTAQKARILLMMVLTVSSDPDEIRRMFDTYTRAPATPAYTTVSARGLHRS